MIERARELIFTSSLTTIRIFFSKICLTHYWKMAPSLLTALFLSPQGINSSSTLKISERTVLKICAADFKCE